MKKAIAVLVGLLVLSACALGYVPSGNLTVSGQGLSVTGGTNAVMGNGVNIKIATVESASTALVAASALTAGYAATAGSAGTAGSANTAGYASLSGVASTAATVDYATLSGTASTAAFANYAILSGTSSACTGSIASADYATLSGTSSASAYAILSATASTCSGAASLNVLKSGDTMTGKLVLPSLESTVATGVAPFKVASTTVNTNLNADLLDGLHIGQSGSSYVPYSDVGGFIRTTGVWETNYGRMYVKYNAHDIAALDVTNTDEAGNAAKFSGSIEVTGRATLPIVNIDGGSIDGTAIGANSASTGKFTSLAVDNLKIDETNEIWEDVTNGDTGTVWINYRGYQGGTTKFRDFNIGDGKTNPIVSVDGSATTVAVNGDIYTATWEPWTPVLSGPTRSPTYTRQFIARYKQLGKHIFWQISFANSTGGTTGEGTGKILITLPVACSSNYVTDDNFYNSPIGYGYVYARTATGSGTYYLAQAAPAPNDTSRIYIYFNTTDGAFSNLNGALQGHASRAIFLHGDYEID